MPKGSATTIFDWQAFARRFKADSASWYFPHATIEPDELQRQLAVFGEFDGVTWHDADANARLRAEGLTTGDAAGTRMMRKALENAGLLWLDAGTLRITPAGREVIAGADPTAILERVLWRYQLSTPINHPGPLRLFPHAALLQTLRLTGGYLTRDEFTLFVAPMRTVAEVARVARTVKAWRARTAVQREAVLTACKQRFAGKVRDAGYCMNFHATASYLERYSDASGRKGIRVVDGAMPGVAKRLDAHAGDEWIHYASIADAIAAYGAGDRGRDLLDAVDHYLDTSQFDLAVAAFRRLPPTMRSGRSPEEFERSAFLERDLEIWLFDHLDAIEPGLQPEGCGRQYPTTVGTMDIFARSQDGDLVVVELKKVRASDQVFGQICRYMGWVKLKYAPAGSVVRGYIIGSEIDPKLQYAASVVGEATVRLKRFHRDAEDPSIWLSDPLPVP